MTKHKQFKSADVEAVFAAYSKEMQSKLLILRQLIFDVAAQTKGVGELEETLKWGQMSYLTSQTKSGSLIRIDQIKTQKDKCAIFFHCQTTLVDSFKEMYRDQFEFDGNRSIVFNIKDKLPVEALRHCVSMALTYHLSKKINRIPESKT